MVGTVLKDDLGNFVADQFGQWVDAVHAADKPLPPIEIPNPLEAVAPAAQQIANALAIPGQAVDTARSAFLDWTDSLSGANTQRVAPLAPTSNALEVPPNPAQMSDLGNALPISAPTGDYQRAGNLVGADQISPPSDFLQWTQQVATGGRTMEPPAAAPPPPPSLQPSEEPTGPATLAPVNDKWSTSFDFGSTYTGAYRTGTPHRGIDLVPRGGGGIGTPVEAFVPGRVTNISRDSGAGGLMVYVEDANGLTHAYMHLAGAAPGLKVGDTVQRGQAIATMGESGTEGSPHLHYEVRRNAATGDPLDRLIDPRPYMRGEGVAEPANRARVLSSPTDTTAGISGGGARSGGVGDRGNAILAGAADIASWLGEQGQKALQAVLITEGGLNNARGDQGHSAGPLQFYGGPRGGQLNNFARAMGLGLEEAKQYVEQHPLEAVQWAIGTASNPGYLGRAIADGIARNLQGAELATHAQRTGQVSVSPERAGANYNAMFGGGGAAVTGGPSDGRTDVLGASQRLLASTAENLASGASQARQDASAGLTDWMLERQRDTGSALESATGGFRAPVTAAFQTAEDVGRGVLQSPLTPWGAAQTMRDIGTAVRPGLEEAVGAASGVREQIANAPVLGGALDIARKQTWLLEDRELLEEATPDQIEMARRYASLTNPNPTDEDIAGVLRGFRAGENVAAGRVGGGPVRAAGRAAGQAARASGVEKALAVGVNNLLGNPASMLTNALSGVGENVYRPFATAVVRRELGPAFADLRAQGAAVGDALSNAWHTFRTGERRSGLDTPDYPEAFPGWAGANPFTTGNLRVNAAMDEFNRMLANAGGQGAELSRLVRANPGLDEFGLLDRFRGQIEDAGTAASKAATFESGGIGLGEKLAASRRAMTDPNAAPLDRILGALTNVLVPFSKIPDAVITRGVLGVPGMAEGRAAVQIARALKSGDGEAVKAAVSQLALTEAVNAAIAWQVLSGNITGNGPENRARRDALIASGDWQPNSFRVPTPWGSRFIPYSSLGPIAIRLGAIANFIEQADEASKKPDADLEDFIGAFSKATGETITDAWYLQNVGRVFQAMRNGSIFNAAGDQVLDFAERYVPDAALANQLRGLMDPVVREPTNPLEDIANRIPGLSQFVAPRIDPATGEPVERPKDIGSLLTRSPAPAEPDAVNEALARHNLGVPEAPNTVTRGSATLQLNDDEKRRYLELTGPEVGRRVESVIGGASYDGLPIDQQRRRLEGAIRTGREAGEAKLWASIPLEERNQRVREYREAQKRQAEPSVRLP